MQTWARTRSLQALLLVLLLPLAFCRDAGFGEALANTSPYTSTTSPIPKIVHFIFGLVLGAGDFEFHHYLAVKSAYDVIQPDAIYFWMHYDLKGQWWDAAKPMVNVRRIDLIDTVYGHPIHHFAHRADVLRLKVLHEYGGIYLDMDVVSLKSFDDILNHSFVLGQEGESGEIGLCNGVILSQPRAPFLRRWMASYQSFDGLVWAWHSVAMPNYLSKIHPTEIHIMDHRAFFAPLWNEGGLQKMYLEKTYDFSHNYAVHLWESNARKWFLEKLSPDLINSVDLSFTCAMRRFVNASNADISACSPAKDNAYTDSSVAWYSFDADASDDPKVRDSLANELHGWALNGTSISEDPVRGGKIRNFPGHGEFAVLPSAPTTTLNDFSLQFSMKFADLQQDAASVLALQSEEYTILIEGYMASNMHMFWLKAFPSLQAEDSLLWDLTVHERAFVADEWITVALRANSSSQSLELFADGHLLIRSQWPPAGSWGNFPIKNIWLGARPASPFPDDVRKEAKHDLIGAMDDVIIWDKPVSEVTLASVASDPAAAFKRHLSLLAHGHQSAVIDIEIATKDKLAYWHDRASKANGQSTLPLSLEKIWPKQESQWRLSWVMLLDRPFVSAGQPAPGDVWAADEDLLGISFRNDVYIGVTFDTASGQLLLRQYGFDFPTIRRTISTRPCSLSAGVDLSLALSIEVNKTENTLALYCGHSRMLSVTLVGLNETGQPLLSQIDSKHVSIWQARLHLGRASESQYARSLSDLHANRPAFTLRLRDELLNLDAARQSHSPVALPHGTLQNGSITVSVDRAIQVKTLTPILEYTNTDTAWIRDAPVVSAIPLGQNRFRIQANGLSCWTDSEQTLKTTLSVPELFRQFTWTIACDQLPLNDLPKLSTVSGIEGFAGMTQVLNPATVSLKAFFVIVGCLIACFRWRAAKAFLRRLAGPAIQLPDSPKTMTSGKETLPDTMTLLQNRVVQRWVWLAVIVCGGFIITDRDHIKASSLREVKGNFVASKARVDHVGRLKRSALQRRAQSKMNHGSTKPLSPPTFTIVTPCYGQAQWLPEVHRYLTQQTYPWFQWIIVNDGSPDQCLATAQSIQAAEKHIPVQVIDKAQGGLADARNVGIEQATSEWICLLDADDGLDPLYLELAADAIRRDPSLSAVNADQRFFGDSQWLWEVPKFNATDMLYRGLFPVQTIFRKQDWLKVGGFEPTLPWGNEDWSFWISLSHLPGFKIRKLDGALLLYRFKAVSMQREKETHKEVVPMMMTLHPDKYSQNELLLAHAMIGRFMDQATLALLDELGTAFPGRRPPSLWKGIAAEQIGDWQTAAIHYRESMRADPSGSDWQPAYRLKIVEQQRRISGHNYHGL